MNRRYCVVSDTYFIKNCVHPYNIRYTYCGSSLEDVTSNLNFDFEFTEEFFRHIRFYEVLFNDKEQPTYLRYLKNTKDSYSLANGWLSLNEYFDKINFHFSLFKKEDQWYDSNTDLLKAMLSWGREVAEQRIRESIIDSIENEEDKKEC